MVDEVQQEYKRPEIIPLEEMKKERPEKFGLQTLMIVAICVMFFSSIASTVGVVLIRSTQKSNTPIARDTHAVVEYIQECQNPDSECSAKQRKALSKALAGIDKQNRKVSAAGASCSLVVPVDLPQHKRYMLIKRCIDETLAAQ